MVAPLAGGFSSNGIQGAYNSATSTPITPDSASMDKTDHSGQITTQQQAIQILEQALGVQTLRMDPVQAIEMCGLDTGEKMNLLQVLKPNLYSRMKTLRADRPDIPFDSGINFCQSGDFSQFMGVLKQRTDLQPQSIEDMLSKVGDAFSNFGPEAGPLIDAARNAAASILVSNTSVSPSELGAMFEEIGSHAQSPDEALQGIQSASEVLSTRGDISPRQISQLFSTITSQSNPMDGGRSFSTAMQTLEKNKSVQPEDLANLFQETRSSSTDPQGASAAFDEANALLQNNAGLSPERALAQSGNANPVSLQTGFQGVMPETSSPAGSPSQSLDTQTSVN